MLILGSYRYSQIWFWYWCRFPKWRDWTIRYTKKGMVKLAISRLLKLSAVVYFLLGFYRARQEGTSLRDYIDETQTMFMSYGKLLAVAGIDQLRKQLKNAKDYIVQM